MKKPRLLVLGDGGAPTGFARVVESILKRLVERYEIHHLAVNYKGDPHGLPWSLYPAATGGGAFGVERIGELARKTRPDLVFIVNDLWIQRAYWEALDDALPETPIVSYCPVDGGPLDAEWVEALPERVELIAYTEFGRGQLADVLSEERGSRVRVVPHGIDNETFRPLEGDGQRRARQKLGLEEDAFIVLNANRNQPRKRIDLTLEGFAAFSEGKPENVQLLLHMGTTDVGWDVRKLAGRLGIERRVILTGPPSGRGPSVSDEQLNWIYNASDLGLNTSGGEGWGLPALEHAAVGRAQILPRHSALAEIWNGAARFLDAPDRVTQATTLLEFHFTRSEHVAEALEELYVSDDLRKEFADRCYSVSQRPDLDWRQIAEVWDGIFQESLAASPQVAPTGTDRPSSVEATH